ncbi:MAG: helix-turn-helix domain-containing protein [Bacteroidetes bacterium]|nr:helix-turn-helix domain-containing protein [Bacteroidota bacterium]
MIERVLELMRIKNLTSSQLADAIKVQRSGISHFVSGRNKPSMEFVLKILNYFPEVNPDWLLFGKEPVLRKSAQNLNGDYIPEDDREHDPGLNDELSEVPQPSFLGELFPGQESAKRPNHNDLNELPADQTLKREVPRKKEVKSLKRETTGEEIENSAAFKDGSAERIVIFYKNRTFREYYPE